MVKYHPLEYFNRNFGNITSLGYSIKHKLTFIIREALEVMIIPDDYLKNQNYQGYRKQFVL